MRVVVQDAPFDFGREAESFAKAQTNMGAVVTFTGIVRDSAKGDMAVMEIEHYPGMTQKALEKIASEAMERWELGDALVIHRYGRLHRDEMIMMVATAARHRVAAFEAAEFLMDYLKSRAPFWKKEIGADGADWVAAREEDDDALSRW
ncbi:molybdenum cofactor biosynthesis protein MoaE [Primorskyibacter aestuariivivens]|uniref:molybdenum cofactor biosynthesis protein MoaE n=1 Tax=Primorskyibacter aestuariivivens TaxID=1888912 RepID=UPI0023011AC0|nr:molybdenum cofactor biosynthesis protein MoaE [Primorskyibacter aestuariivivens]MDA7430525.1 molybdenum cofactor biosynthesis protein MoaE [Primorskyibacter aestuariivivens]